MSDPFDQHALAARADALVQAATRAGADSADAIAMRSMSVSAEVRLGAVEEVDRSEADDLGLRVFLGSQQAMVATNSLDEDIDSLAARAVAMARVAPEDRYAGVAEAGQLGMTAAELDLVDRTVPETDALVDRALEAEEAGRAVAGITNSGGASASWGLSGIALAASNGFAGDYMATSHGTSCTMIAGEGTAMERDYDWSSARHLADLDSAADIGRRSAERTVRRLDPQKAETFTGTVIYEPRVAASLVGHLAGAVNGLSITRKASFLKDDMGKRVFAPGIRISDDPLRPRGLRSKPFDAEGIATAPLTLVEDGVLASWVLHLASARELGLETTGNAQRGVSSVPAPGTTNLTLHAGDASPGDLIGGISSGLFVSDLIGHGGNIVTGDYSRGAAGFMIENGEIAGPVSEVTIAGNLRDMFASLVPADDLQFSQATNAPTVAIEGMTIAGR